MVKRSFLAVSVGIAIVIIAGLIYGFVQWNRIRNAEPVRVTNFEECVAAGYPVAESYPRRCRIADSLVFTEDIGNALEKADLIRVTFPRPNEVIASPLRIGGEARGYWYFEASFPVRLLDGNGKEIATIPPYIMTSNEWMTEDFVPFDAVIEFVSPATERGTLVLQKDNPSGLPEHDDELRIPIRFR